MRKASLKDVPVEERVSPKGTFRLLRQHLSVALGIKRDQGVWAGGHPFEVERAVLPPGKTNWPYHQHAATWEFYYVLEGRGEARTPAGWTSVEAGDAFVCPPGEPHQMRNPGTADLVYLVVADNPPADVNFYPDSGKTFLKPGLKSVRLTEIGYYDGEE